MKSKVKAEELYDVLSYPAGYGDQATRSRIND